MPRLAGGEWFVNVTNGVERANSWEFHDSDDSLSICGHVISILWGTPFAGSTNIAGFTILATVSNHPAAGLVLPPLSTNSHLEAQRSPQPYYHQPLWNTHLAAEMPVTDIRHSVIRYSFMNAADVLYNRSESLKISHWLDSVLVDSGNLIISPPDPEFEPIEYVSASDVSVFFDSAAPGQVPARQITPIFSGQTLCAVQLYWPAFDVKPVVLQYCDDLAANKWNNVPVSFVPPPLIPGPMGWVDNGSVILPPLPSPRFYRLQIP